MDTKLWASLIVRILVTERSLAEILEATLLELVQEILALLGLRLLSQGNFHTCLVYAYTLTP